jgi:hypothetical protein
VWKRWKSAHPEPTDSKDVAGWKRYNAAVEALQLGWIQQYPDATNPPDYWRFLFMQSDDSIAEQQGVAIAEKSASAMSAAYPPSMRMYSNLQPAEYLLDHKWAPEKALAYLQEAKNWQGRSDAEYRAQDDHSESDLKDHAKEVTDLSRFSTRRFSWPPCAHTGRMR